MAATCQNGLWRLSDLKISLENTPYPCLKGESCIPRFWLLQSMLRKGLLVYFEGRNLRLHMTHSLISCRCGTSEGQKEGVKKQRGNLRSDGGSSRGKHSANNKFRPLAKVICSSSGSPPSGEGEGEGDGRKREGDGSGCSHFWLWASCRPEHLLLSECTLDRKRALHT